ncbi:AmmeMemoRadiSam system protein B [Batrachochytrium salamandrivorans]|nr:AmmeMemoRadiSam system protein B [Batrachochytrium salamandrivorans]
MRTTRRAAHAGTWYESNPDKLGQELDGYLSCAGPPAKAIIAPHAGYRYSGRTAGACYSRFKSLPPGSVKVVYILGPLHHFRSEVGLLSLATTLETPLGELQVDSREQSWLLAELPGLFKAWPSLAHEEQEHSLEMHLPLVARVFGLGVKVVPIGLGRMSSQLQLEMGQVIAQRVLVNPQAVVVVSSDFCHWGPRFRYQFRVDTTVPIHQSVAELDRRAMDLIRAKDFVGFQAYLRETGNTICGQRPIAVLLAAVEGMEEATIEFVHYEQSMACTSMDHNSVSYAAGVMQVT